MTLPVIAPLPPAPNRTQPALFSARMDDFLAALPIFGGELTAMGYAISQLASDTAADAAAALQHKQDAQQALQQAQGQVQLAANQVALAATQATLAGGHADDAEAARAAALAAAAAAGAAAGLPALVGQARKSLCVKTNESGVEWTSEVTPPNIARAVKTSAYTIQASDKGGLIDCSGTWTLGLAAAATLGAGWWCYVRNIATGTITADPNGTELIDGLPSGAICSGMALLIQCDGTTFHCVRVGPQMAITVLTSGTSWTVPLGVRNLRAKVQGSGARAATGAPSSGAYTEAVLNVAPGDVATYAIGAAATVDGNGSASSLVLGGRTLGAPGGSSTKPAVATGGDINFCGMFSGNSMAGNSLLGNGGNAGYSMAARFGGGGYGATNSGQGVIVLEY